MSEESDGIRFYDYWRVMRNRVVETEEPVAVEESYDLIINGIRRVSIMASPMDIEALGYGYLLSERLVSSKENILSVELIEYGVHMEVASEEHLDEWIELRSSGCVGIKWRGGAEPEVDSKLSIGQEFVFRSLRYLDTYVYKRTSGSHSATLIDKKREALATATDVGRHNSYDKVIGKAVLQDVDFSETILLSSGRQSAGMVMKAARVGIPIIISKAAPLSSGIEAAEKTGVTLICFANDEKFSIFAHPERIEGVS